MMSNPIKWPDGKRFAFTVFDDTDHTTMENGPEVYRFMYDLGMLTTKSVWPVEGERKLKDPGATCSDYDYLKWVQRLKEQGIEIALHNVTYHTSKREETIAGLEQFKSYFGEYPKAHANHVGCDENIYWGDARLSGVNRLIYNMVTGFRNHGISEGENESGELYWADKCKQYIKYVRNFTFSEINTLNICPYMPYFDRKRPFVNYWFASSEGTDCRTFCVTVSESHQDQLEEEGGACIMYAHFGIGFYENRRLNADFKRLMERLSRRSGWFVPVSTLLDHMQKVRGHYSISDQERRRLERKWLAHKVFETRGRT